MNPRVVRWPELPVMALRIVGAREKQEMEPEAPRRAPAQSPPAPSTAPASRPRWEPYLPPVEERARPQGQLPTTEIRMETSPQSDETPEHSLRPQAPQQRVEPEETLERVKGGAEAEILEGEPRRESAQKRGSSPVEDEAVAYSAGEPVAERWRRIGWRR